MATGERGGGGGLLAGVHVTLRAPRPDASRQHNEYVDTPLRGPHPQNEKKKWTCGGAAGAGSSAPPLTRQPGPPPGKKAGPAGLGCTIICSECGKCRCEACRAPPRPPSVWLCSDFCYCSLDSCVDYASCLCCVKGLMYHWGAAEDDSSGADEPCSCRGPACLSRWTCLALASLCLPCLCCYCPLKACADASGRLYAACSRARGCSCPPAPRL